MRLVRIDSQSCRDAGKQEWRFSWNRILVKSYFQHDSSEKLKALGKEYNFYYYTIIMRCCYWPFNSIQLDWSAVVDLLNIIAYDYMPVNERNNSTFWILPSGLESLNNLSFIWSCRMAFHHAAYSTRSIVWRTYKAQLNRNIFSPSHVIKFFFFFFYMEIP